MLAGATTPPLRRWRAGPLLESLPVLSGREPLHRRHECRCKAVEQGRRSERNGKRWATGALPPSPFIAEEGQPAPPTIAGNDSFRCMSQGLVKSGSCRGSMEKRRRSRPISCHTAPKAAGCWDPRHFALAPFASLLSQVQARLGPGGYCRRSGNVGPQTCLPAARGVALLAAQYGPSSPTSAQDPREGPSLAWWTTRSFLRQGLPYAAPYL